MTAKGNKEIARFLSFLAGLRNDFFMFWEQVVLPTAAVLVEDGVPEAFTCIDTHRMLAAVPCVNVHGASDILPRPTAVGIDE